MSIYSKEVPDERLRDSQVDEVVLEFIISGAKTISQVTLQNAPVIAIFDTGSSSQAEVDALLGDVSDIAYATSFSAVALGTDALGFVVSHGAAKRAVSCAAYSIQVAGGTPTNFQVLFNGNGASTTALASSLGNKFAVTPGGHLYGTVVLTNIDATTSGSIRLVLRFKA